MVLINNLFMLRQLMQNIRLFHSSKITKGYEGPGKTTMDILNIQNKQQILINKCLPIGFKLNDNSLILGPLAIFPEIILAWNIDSTKDINEATLSLFTILYPTIDLLILGLESNYEYKRILEIKKILFKYQIKTEILPVEHACGIYNFLKSDGRYVAAGLIPPLPKTISHQKPLQKSPKQLTEEKNLIDT
ncbi:NADH dehydrogenase [ubiquinone] 1 alpha subcomplex assembly factor 3 [Apis cerana]|uniref:NADH dehydrogenase [ubiquinone] 1 alpha subcomplex assembly factor n=1 Tax=Apis cerana cerana TaxID=94128 RepID=A0A2A3EGQ7_APICC|nr:NADH dehydrogenase [ubiquinone] 1 alpha subcomplex assembly factor 3 [Apis cerana]PBC30191.1 NADH dehydrogenase [ubiquinone] 1 alpha subcomplex assembly factor [Apis cerana cerana]